MWTDRFTGKVKVQKKTGKTTFIVSPRPTWTGKFFIPANPRKSASYTTSPRPEAWEDLAKRLAIDVSPDDRYVTIQFIRTVLSRRDAEVIEEVEKDIQGAKNMQKHNTPANTEYWIGFEQALRNVLSILKRGKE